MLGRRGGRGPGGSGTSQPPRPFNHSQPLPSPPTAQAAPAKGKATGAKAAAKPAAKPAAKRSGGRSKK